MAPPSNNPPSAPKPQAPRKLSPRKPKYEAPRLVVYGVEGWGKTTLGAYAPSPLILMSRGETGYDTLLGVRRVPAVPAEIVTTWSDLLRWLDDLGTDSQNIKTLVLDAMGGFERLCHERVCLRDFDGKWGDDGFLAYHKGYDRAVGDWLGMLARLDRIREVGVTILILGHARIQPFKNPLGSDFDRYECDVHRKTWAVTHKWSDAVLFGTFLTLLDDANKARPKGIGGTDRVAYAERRDAFDAKSRYGIVPQIWFQNDRAASWSAIAQYLPEKKP